MFDFEPIIAAVNSVALGLFFIFVGSGLTSMIRRGRLFRVAKEPLPILLKRAIAMYVGLALFGGTILAVRVTGVVFDPHSFERLMFVVGTSLTLLAPLAYYTKADIFDLDDPNVK